MLTSIKLLSPGTAFIAYRTFNITFKRNFKVTIVGAAGGIGQPLSMLLKMSSLVTHLALYDVAPVTPGVAVDLSHINTTCKVTGHKGPKQLDEAIQCASVVIIPAGLPRKPGMSRGDLFKTNAGIIRDVCKAIARNSPLAIVAIVTNPVNATVPVAAEVLKREGVYDPRRVMGVTTLDIVRSCTFVGEINNIDPENVFVPVIGGHSGKTIIPLFSQSNPQVAVSDKSEIKSLTEKVQEAGTTVVKAKSGHGSATLSMAFAGAKFTTSILRGLCGEPNIMECAYVATGLCLPSYFASPVVLGQCGIVKNLGFCCLTPYEKKILQAAMPELLTSIATGEDFVIRNG